MRPSTVRSVAVRRSAPNVGSLADAVRDPLGFRTHRIRHHPRDVCCRGFWDKHKNDFTLGQIAQRLGRVEFVDIDVRRKPDDL